MKKLLIATCMLCCMTAIQAQIKMPAPSPAQTIRQNFGLSYIELSYSRPGVKGRTIFGDLLSYGKLWRTGANAPTTLEFGDEVTIGGKIIPAGKYGLLSIPDKNSWTLIITKQTNVSSSAAAYKPEEDVVRVVAPVKKMPSNIETLSMQFANVKAQSCELQICWDNVQVSLPITTEIDSKIMADISNSLQSDKPAYFQAATYYLENGKDLSKANEWFAKAVEAQPDAYWIRYQQARALAKSGNKTAAKAAALKSIELAKTAKNDDYVALNEKLIAELK